jgi:hypothetical protein
MQIDKTSCIEALLTFRLTKKDIKVEMEKNGELSDDQKGFNNSNVCQQKNTTKEANQLVNG